MTVTVDAGHQLVNLNDKQLNLKCHMCGKKSGADRGDGKATVLKPHHVFLRKHRRDAYSHLRHRLRDWRMPNGQEFQLDELVPVCDPCHYKYHCAINDYEAERFGGMTIDDWFELYPTFGYLIYAAPPKGPRAIKSVSHQKHRAIRNAIASHPPGTPRASWLSLQIQPA